MPRRIDLGRAVLLAGAALLFVSLFVEWYDTGPTGWQVFETLDIVLAGLAVAGAVMALRPHTTPPWWATAVPAAALVIVLVQLVDAPPAAGDGDASTGAWLALAGSFLMAAGSSLSLAAISVTVQVRERDVRRRVAAVDRRGAGDADLAEDLDADAEGPVQERRPANLFSGLSGPGAPGELELEDEPPARAGRFAQRRPAAGEPAGGAVASGDVAADADEPVPGAPAPGRPEAAELERTQPLHAVGDGDEEGAERS